MALRDYLFHEEPGITLYCGDCLDVLPLIEQRADLVLTDPPFEAEAHALGRRVLRRGGIAVEALPFAPIRSDVRVRSAEEMTRLSKRWALVFCQVEAAPLWREAYEFAGMKYRRTCIWVKPDAMPQYSGDRPGMGYETILAMHVPGRSEWNGGGRSSVFTCNKNSGGVHEHPTMKPLRLMRDLVSLFSAPGDRVLDPFSGAGSTLVAAKDLGRSAIGIEIEPRYCEIAVKRLRQEVMAFE